jgi:predicted metalloprotease with PDZ domain
MVLPFRRVFCCSCLLLSLLLTPVIGAAGLDPIIYRISVPEPQSQRVQVQATIPTGGAAEIDLMLPIWSPGYYARADYAARVRDLQATNPEGAALAFEHPAPNRIHLRTGGAATVNLSYSVLANRRDVALTYVDNTMGLFTGATACITLVEKAPRPHEVHLTLPPQWPTSISGLEPAPDGRPHHYAATNYDILVDSPILAGDLAVHRFESGGASFYLADLGTPPGWNGPAVAGSLQKIVEATTDVFGVVPFKKYVFMNIQRGGGGGLEHLNSTVLLTAPAAGPPGGSVRWLGIASHEYFHAYNVKRLRPIELGPFDYESTPRTAGLWMAEGFTTYYGDLLVYRAGLGTLEGLLAQMASNISQLQNTPGRLVQTLEAASLDVFRTPNSSGPRDQTISYYVKGPVVAFLLDARLRRLTDGRRSLDDALRIAYQRFSGPHGYTNDEFRQVVEEVAGADLRDWFRHAVASTQELDYSEMQDWFGLRLVTAPVTQPARAGRGGAGGPRLRLELRPDATEAQKARLEAWYGAGRLPTN